MVMPNYHYRETPTGRVRGRRTWLNKIVMQIEVKLDEIAPWGPKKTTVVIGTHCEWRDATIDDLFDKTYSMNKIADTDSPASTASPAQGMTIPTNWPLSAQSEKP